MTGARWPTQLQAQLVATANGVDRGNRPTLFVVLPTIALVAALIVLLPIWARFNGARDTLVRTQRDWEAVRAMVEEIGSRRDSRPDLAVLFPMNQLFGDNVEAAAKQVWSELPMTVGQPTKREFQATKTELKKFDVVCSLRTVRLEQLTQWIDRVLASPHLQGVFVSNLELRPVPGGWTGTVVFRRYQYDPSSTGS